MAAYRNGGTDRTALARHNRRLYQIVKDADQAEINKAHPVDKVTGKPTYFRDKNSDVKPVRRRDMALPCPVLAATCLLLLNLSTASASPHSDVTAKTNAQAQVQSSKCIRKREHEAVNRYIQRSRECMDSALGSAQDKSATLAALQTVLSGRRSIKLKPL